MTRQFVFADFSGGVVEARSAADYEQNQWGQLKGFVLESENTLRTQWECQQVSSSTDVKAVRVFRGKSKTWLVAITSGGGIRFAQAPAASSNHATAGALTWTSVTSGTEWYFDTTAYPNNANAARWVRRTRTVSVPNDPNYLFLCEVQSDDDADRFENGLLINTVDGSSPGVVLYEKGDGSALEATVFVQRYPSTYLAPPNTGRTRFVKDANNNWVEDEEKNTEVFAMPHVMPHARVGCLWGNYLVLGDVWFPRDLTEDDPMSATNRVRYPSGLWISTVNASGKPQPHRFHPLTGQNSPVTPSAQIRALVPTERGLLVFTTSATDGDGLILLRGTPPTGSTEISSYVPEVLRGSLNVADVNDGDYTPVADTWGEVGATAFVDASGAVWHTNGSDVGRLDQYGPAVDGPVSQYDHVCSVGPFLFVARNGRLLVMRSFGRAGAWTELVTPLNTAVRSMSADEHALYLVSDGRVWRYTFAGALRGHVNGTKVALSVHTGPVGDPLGHDQSLWFRAGVRVNGLTGARVIDVASVSGWGPQAASLPRLTTAVGENVSGNKEVLVRGHGPSREASVQVRLEGDLVVESVSVWTHGKEPSR